MLNAVLLENISCERNGDSERLFVKKYYVDFEYLICSAAFVKNEYYIASAYEDNYLHLTGLHTSLDAATFLKTQRVP